MGMRWKLGPVFVYENLVLCRRWQMYAGRSLLIASLLIGLILVWSMIVSSRGITTYAGLASFGKVFSAAVLVIELVLALVLVPTVTAGAICQEKMRGGLTLMMTTDLSDAEIVFGKLALRLVTVLGIIACGIPVLAIISSLGGVDPQESILGSLVIVGVAILGASLALFFSVWATRPAEALLMTYATFAIWLLAVLVWGEMRLGPTPDWLWLCNPFWLLGGSTSRPPFLSILFFVGCVMISWVLAMVATRRLRTVTLRQAERSMRRGRRRNYSIPRWDLSRLFEGFGVSLDRHPILWRELHRHQVSHWERGIWWLYAIVSTGFTWITVVFGLDIIPGVVAFMVAIGLLMVSVTSATSLAEERALGNLDVLMASPVSTREIVIAKWWGAFRIVPGLTILPGLLAFVAAGTQRGPLTALPFAGLMVMLILAYGAMVTSVCLALATWQSRVSRAVGISVFVYLVAAVVYPAIVSMMLQAGPDDLYYYLWISPFYGVWMPLVRILWRKSVVFEGNVRPLVWIGLTFSAAYFILWTTIQTFDACLGRVPEMNAGKPSGWFLSRGRSKLSETAPSAVSTPAP